MQSLIKFSQKHIIFNSSRFLNTQKLQYDELVLLRLVPRVQGYFQFRTKLVKLEKKGVIYTRYFDILHEHIINRLSNECKFQIFKDDPFYIEIRRPTLHEYMNEMSLTAVSSHFSILSLVPFLLEIDKNSKILESGTGNGCMTLYLSKNLGLENGQIHTFDLTETKVKNAEVNFKNWINSYNLVNTNKWCENVKFNCGNIHKHEFDESLNEYYDAIYLDLLKPHLALLNVTKLLRFNGVIVINSMQLLQLIQCLNIITKYNLPLENELVIEPGNRQWEIGKPIDKRRKLKQKTDKEKIINDDDCDDPNLNYICRIEHHDASKKKLEGLYCNYWPGYLMKLRKISN